MVTQRADLSNLSAMIPGAEAPAKDKGTLTNSFQSYFAGGSQMADAGSRTSETVTNLKTGYDQKGEYDKINSTYTKQADRVNRSRVDQKDNLSDSDQDAVRSMSDEEIQAVKEEIYSVVKEYTGMTDEEIDAVLETMDISVFQLLQPEVLQDFLMIQSGTEPVDMLTNSELIQTFQDMNQGMQNIFQEQDIDVTEQDMEALIRTLEDYDQEISVSTDDTDRMDAGMELQNTDPSSSVEETIQTDRPVQTEDNISITEENVSKNVISNEQDINNAENVTVTVEDTEKTDQKTTKFEKEDAGQKTDEMIDTDKESGIQVSVRNADNKKEHNSSDMMNQNPSFAGDIVNQLSQAVQETESVATSYTSVLEQQDIVRQVVEQIRIWNAGENSRMQVQLYPEHLGRIEIQVMLRNGTMTAQITAETEMAKAAIESQIQALKESFEQKNMQVNAIEVSVGTPDFRDNEDRQDSMKQNSQTGSGRRRNGIGGGFGTDNDSDVSDLETERLEAQGASVEFKA